MAVSGDFFTVSGVEQIESEARNDLNLLMVSQGLDIDNLISKTIEDIQNKINDLKTQEGQFLSMFDCFDIAEFKNRVANYYNYTTIGSFTGSNLKTIIEDFKAIHNDKLKMRQDFIERIVYNLLNNNKYSQNFSKELIDAFKNKQVTEAFAQEMVAMVLKVLSGAGLGGGGYLQISSKGSFGSVGQENNGQRAFEIAARLTTTAFDKHIMDLYKVMESGEVDAKVERQMEKDIYYRQLSDKEKRAYLDRHIQLIKQRAHDLLQPIPVKTQISGGQMKQTFSYKINEAIESATGGVGVGSGKASDIDESLLGAANEKIQKVVVEELMSHSPDNSPELRRFVNDRVYSMIQKDPHMFFIGHSYTGLEGVLGEISAVCALTMLLGDKYRPRAIKWIGSELGAGKKKPSVDIALREIGGIQFGIQIKNTIDDLKDDFLHNIGFVDASVDLVLKKLGINPINFENALFSDNFNVPYKQEGYSFVQKSGETSFKHGGTFKNGTYDEYLKVDKAIDEVVADIYSYLTLYASDFMYIGMDKGFKSKLATLDVQVLTTGGNYVYIVGPRVFFASEMLEQLKEDLTILQMVRDEAQQISFQLDSYIEKQKGDSGTYNIVSVLNGRNGGKEGVVSHTVKMRSSWTFHN